MRIGNTSIAAAYLGSTAISRIYLGAAQVFGAPAPSMVTRNAVNMFGPGHSSGNGRTTSTGTPVNANIDFVNRSGAPITLINLVFSGWWLTTTGTSAIGNDYPITASIQSPIGTTIATITSGGNSTITVPNGTDIVTDQSDISATPIAAGATFRIVLSTTTPNGQFYTTNQLGLTGVLTTAMSDTLKKEMIYAIGDSIMTNNNGALHTVANTASGCPSFHTSIGGTTAQAYAGAGNFARQVALAKRLGATRFLCNFATNDFGSNSRTLAQVQADLTTLRDAALAEGIGWTQCTVLPRTSQITVTASAAVGSGNTITLTVPNGALFDVGQFYTIAGAVESGYNGTRVCSGVSGNDVSFISEGVSGTPATGTITIVERFRTCSRLQTPASWESTRVAFNAWLRGGGLSNTFVEWADACEPFRDSGRWATGTESPYLQNPAPLGTVSAIINTSRFRSTGTTIVGNGGAGGAVGWASGPNIGLSNSVNGTAGGNDITLTAAPANTIAIGHTFYIIGGVGRASDDGTHPRVATGGFGGQEMLNQPLAAWLAARLA